MKNILCHKCKKETVANNFVCLHCGALLGDNPNIKNHRKPELICKRLTILFILLAILFVLFFRYFHYDFLIKLFGLSLGFMMLSIGQTSVYSGKTYTTALTMRRDKNPVAFWIIVSINYGLGFVAVLWSLWLLVSSK